MEILTEIVKNYFLIGLGMFGILNAVLIIKNNVMPWDLLIVFIGLLFKPVMLIAIIFKMFMIIALWPMFVFYIKPLISRYLKGDDDVEKTPQEEAE